MKNKLVFLFTLFSLFLIGCSSNSSVKYKKNVDMDQAISGPEVRQYFLGQMPPWANFSSSSSCFRKSQVYYLNYKNLHSSYGFSYEKNLQLQLSFNKKISEFIQNSSSGSISQKEESYLFYRQKEVIDGGHQEFLVPDYKQFALLWIDPYLDGDKLNVKKLKKLFSLKVFDTHYPIIYTNCFTYYELQNLLQEYKIDYFTKLYFTAEMQSVYDSKFNQRTKLFMDLNRVFSNKKVTILTPKGKLVPPELFGVNLKKDI